MKLSFNERRATQVAGILFGLNQGRPIDRIKLLCLLYICERRDFDKWGEPMIGDEYVAIREGPVLKSVLALTADPAALSSDLGSYWNQFLCSDGERVCRRQRGPMPKDETSRADRDIIKAVFNDFGQWDAPKLAEHTRGFHEWHNPAGPIPVEAIFKALNCTPEQIEYLIEDLEERELTTRLLA